MSVPMMFQCRYGRMPVCVSLPVGVEVPASECRGELDFGHIIFKPIYIPTTSPSCYIVNIRYNYYLSTAAPAMSGDVSLVSACLIEL
jgi:hypothetical protein